MSLCVCVCVCVCVCGLPGPVTNWACDEVTYASGLESPFLSITFFAFLPSVVLFTLSCCLTDHLVYRVVNAYVSRTVCCLTSQQQASVFHGRICTDNLTCCYTEIEVADPTFYLTQSQYTDTGPTSPSADPISPGAWQGSYWSVNV